MIAKQRSRIYDIDDLWQFLCHSDDSAKYELIDGEFIEMPGPGGQHGLLAGEIYFYIRQFDPERRLGVPTVEAGYYAATDRHTLLLPDVAFTVKTRAPAPFPRKWVPVMPDLAVEIMSPSNSRAELRQKVAIYLRYGAQLVWLVLLDMQAVEVCRLRENGEVHYQLVQRDGSLSGEAVLPGFELELRQLFAGL